MACRYTDLNQISLFLMNEIYQKKNKMNKINKCFSLNIFNNKLVFFLFL